MDQDPMVNDQIQCGWRLIEALTKSGFEVQVAFWAKPTADGKWFLYLASPFVDEKGPGEAYRHVLGVVRNAPELGVDRSEVKVLGLKDSLTQAALAVIKLRIPDSQFAAPSPKPYPGMIRFGGSALSWLDIDGAVIYPPLQPKVSA